MDRTLTVDIQGDYACFTDPLHKIHRYSYPIPTPSALRGLLDSIYWHPRFRWEIRKIEVLSPIRYASILINEVKEKIQGEHMLPLVVDDPRGDNHGRTQRFTTYLRDVHYRVTCEIISREAHHDWQRDMSMLVRRVQKGKYYRHPYLGLAWMPAKVQLVKDVEHLPPLADSSDFGFMLYDVFPLEYDVETCHEIMKVDPSRLYQPSTYHAVMHHGVIEVPAYLSQDVVKSDNEGRDD